MTPTERREQEQRDRVRAALARTDSSEGLAARLRTMADLGAAGRGPAWFRKASPTASEAADRIEVLEGRDAHLYADTVDRLLAESQRQLAVAQAQIEALKGERDAAILSLKWVQQVYPSARAGGAWVSMTWDELNRMRDVCGLRPLAARGAPGERASVNLNLRAALADAQARLSALDPGGLGSSKEGRDQGASYASPSGALHGAQHRRRALWGHRQAAPTPLTARCALIASPSPGMPQMTDFKEDRLRKVARIIAETAIGIPLTGLMKNKSEWVALRGEKNGAYRDVNDPFIADVNDAAAQIEAEYAEEIGRLRAGLEAIRDDTWNDGRGCLRAVTVHAFAALALSTVPPEPSGAGEL